MNEQTHFFIKNIISHHLFWKGWCFCCVRDELETEQTATYWSQVLLTIAALLPHLGLGCSTVGHWGPKALFLPLALNSASCLQLSKYPNSQPITFWHDVIHTPVLFPIWGLLWLFVIVIFSAHERRLYPMSVHRN